MNEESERKPLHFDPKRIELGLEALRLLDIIASEFKSDPMSVQCFDRRIVEASIELSNRARDLGYLHEAWSAHNRKK